MQLADLYHDDELQRITQIERDNEIAALVDNAVAKKRKRVIESDLETLDDNADRMEGELAAKIRRIDIRRRLRRGIASEDFDKLAQAEERVKFIEELNRDRTLRAEVRDDDQRHRDDASLSCGKSKSIGTRR